MLYFSNKIAIMNDVIHIHEVLGMIFTSEELFTKGSLIKEITNRFGDNPQFTSCSENTFELNEVIPFLLDRQKISIDGDRIIPISIPCDH